MLGFNNKILRYNQKWIKPWVDPLNPLNLPPNTVRVRTSDGEPPKKLVDYTSYETAVLVPGTTDVYDVYKSGTSFRNMLYNSDNLVEVLGANTSGITDMRSMLLGITGMQSVQLFDTSSVTDMSYMFKNAEGLTSIPLFDTSSCTNMANMFEDCTYLTSVPLFNTSSATNMDYMFYECIRVESGALALYQQASGQTNPPSSHYRTFYGCGRYSTSGAEELAQIPDDWK